jgi:hypothetical protein
LNNPNLQGPIAMLDGNPEYVTYLVTVTDRAGCFDTASITIQVYKTGPKFLYQQDLLQMVMAETMYSDQYMLQ